ncbi:hypothetical protein AAHE18_07G111300 [Arachis hypogaea]
MRVLAVDYDRACLRMLEQMLLKCRYNVTATTQSRKAIEMLRENKVISDVHMPGIDGFQLLELVGLEMDLPLRSKFKAAVYHLGLDKAVPRKFLELMNVEGQAIFR